jgi:hypothetical protein
MAGSTSSSDAEETPFDADDVIVAELDVYACGAGAAAARPFLLRFPTRAPDRALEGVSSVRYKERVGRLQLEARTPGGANRDADAPAALAIKTMTLEGARADPGAAPAVGFFAGGALHLLPVAEAVQLRHATGYYDAAAAARYGPRGAAAAAAAAAGGAGPSGAGPSGRGAAAEAELKPGEGSLRPLAVTVQRFETEQQVEARLRSFAYLAQREASDAWVELAYRPAAGPAAAAARAALLADPAAARRPGPAFDRATYLDALAPAAAGADDAPVPDGSGGGGGADGGSGAAAAGELGRPGGAAAAAPLAAEAAAALPAALRRLFAGRAIVDLAVVRAELRVGAAAAPDASLHAAVLASGEALAVPAAYIARRPAEPMRAVVAALLLERASVRRQDALAAARAAGVPDAGEAAFLRVVREICDSSGPLWSLKPVG